MQSGRRERQNVKLKPDKNHTQQSQPYALGACDASVRDKGQGKQILKGKTHQRQGASQPQT